VRTYWPRTAPHTTPEPSAASKYELSPAARQELTRLFERMPREEGFGNGRSARQVFQQMTERQSHRLAELPAPTPDQLMCLELADLPSPTAPS
jgi:hypothetical protein